MYQPAPLCRASPAREVEGPTYFSGRRRLRHYCGKKEVPCWFGSWTCSFIRPANPRTMIKLFCPHHKGAAPASIPLKGGWGGAGSGQGLRWMYIQICILCNDSILECSDTTQQVQRHPRSVPRWDSCLCALYLYWLVPNVETLIVLVPASNHFMFWCRSFDEIMSLRMDNDYKT